MPWVIGHFLLQCETCLLGPTGGELLDQRQKRQLGGIGQKEASQSNKHPTKGCIYPNRLHPLRYRDGCQVFGDSPIPSLLGDLIGLQQRLQFVCECLPDPGAVGEGLHLALYSRSDKGKTCVQYGRKIQTEPANQTLHFLVLCINKISTRLRMLTFSKLLSDREDAAAHAIVRLQDRNAGSIPAQFNRRGQSGQSRPHHSDGLPMQCFSCHRDSLQ